MANGGRWRNGAWKWKTVSRAHGGKGKGGGGSGKGKGGGKGTAPSTSATPPAGDGSVPMSWIKRGWQVYPQAKPAAGGGARRVDGATYADVARVPVPAEQARVGQRIVIPERSEEESKRTEVLRKKCISVAANIEVFRVAAKSGGEELTDDEQAQIAAMEAHLHQLRAQRDASKSPEIRYVGSLTKEQQLHKALLASEDHQAMLATQKNELDKAIQAAEEKTAKLRAEHSEAKLRTARDAAEAGVAAPRPEQAAQTMVSALAEQFGAAGSVNPELTAFLQQSAASIAEALQKFTVTQTTQDAADQGGASHTRAKPVGEPQGAEAARPMDQDFDGEQTLEQIQQQIEETASATKAAQERASTQKEAADLQERARDQLLQMPAITPEDLIRQQADQAQRAVHEEAVAAAKRALQAEREKRDAAEQVAMAEEQRVAAIARSYEEAKTQRERATREAVAAALEAAKAMQENGAVDVPDDDLEEQDAKKAKAGGEGSVGSATPSAKGDGKGPSAKDESHPYSKA